MSHQLRQISKIGTATDNKQLWYYFLYNNQTLYQVTNANNTITIGGLQPCTTYEFVGLAVDYGINVSNPEQFVTFTTLSNNNCDALPPSVPLNLVSSNIGTNSLQLQWDASTDNIGVTGYKVYQDNIEIADVNTNSASVNNLSPTTTYNFEVLAYDAAGNTSAKSNTHQATTLSHCAQTLQLEVTAGSNPEYLQWAIKDANYNFVAFSPYGQFATQTPGTTVTYAINTSYLPDGDYNFVFLDFGSNGTSYTLKDGNAILASGNMVAFGNVHQICIRQSQGLQLDQIKPTTVLDLSASNVTQTSVDLDWSVATDANGIFSQLILVNGNIRTNIWNASTNTSTIPNLLPNTSYDFNIVTWDVGGNISAISNTVTVTTAGNGQATRAMIDNIANRETLLEDVTFVLFPNPSSSYFKIKSVETKHKTTEIIVRNLEGKWIKSFGAQQNKYFIEDLTDGLYLIEIKSNNKSIYKKLIKRGH
ncbi:fibronectin type III domain-containing protein [Winogradskyella maritima]|uniref:Fibronectin type III domain-containing protein n=1 Tax=Winogradskyella maritima TaxID=1517766 RepID=A0ABV8AIW9_9FLAO|nr:fibronectin type III domain-containing protein [Winogradskyella maritima]